MGGWILSHLGHNDVVRLANALLLLLQGSSCGHDLEMLLLLVVVALKPLIIEIVIGLVVVLVVVLVLELLLLVRRHRRHGCRSCSGDCSIGSVRLEVISRPTTEPFALLGARNDCGGGGGGSSVDGSLDLPRRLDNPHQLLARRSSSISWRQAHRRRHLLLLLQLLLLHQHREVLELQGAEHMAGRNQLEMVQLLSSFPPPGQQRR